MEKFNELEQQGPDIIIAMEMGNHIERPCSDPIRGHNLREYHVRLAKSIITTFTNEDAIRYLQKIIDRYDCDN